MTAKQLFKTITYLSLIILTLASCSSTRNTVRKRPAKKTEVKKNKTTKLSKQLKLRNDIVTYSKKYIGSKYKYAGKTPKGFDCSGFTHYVMKEFDIILSPSSAAQAKTGKKIPVNKVKAGDLVIFSRDGKTIMHVALVVTNDKNGIRIIHSTSSKGIRMDNITTSSYWKPKIMQARTIIP